jgi:hypothetical protein
MANGKCGAGPTTIYWSEYQLAEGIAHIFGPASSSPAGVTAPNATTGEKHNASVGTPESRIGVSTLEAITKLESGGDMYPIMASEEGNQDNKTACYVAFGIGASGGASGGAEAMLAAQGKGLWTLLNKEETVDESVSKVEVDADAAEDPFEFSLWMFLSGAGLFGSSSALGLYGATHC